jgi:hypothetical protein
MGRRASFAELPGVAVFSVVLASACTSLLGIDGNYSTAHSDSSGGGSGGKAVDTKTGGTSGALFDAGAGGGGNAGTDDGAGGTMPSSGGAPDAGIAGRKNGGAGGVESGGGPSTGGRDGSGGNASGGTSSGGASDSGGASSSGGNASGGTRGTGGVVVHTDAGTPVCPTGTRNGTYTGVHHPSTGGNFVSAPISGSIMLRLTANTNTTLNVTGVLTLPIGMGGIVGSVRGTVDCTDGTGSVSLLDGATVTTVIPPFNGPIDGTFIFKIDTTGALGGTFSIKESLNPSPLAVGSGTWSAD